MRGWLLLTMACLLCARQSVEAAGGTKPLLQAQAPVNGTTCSDPQGEISPPSGDIDYPGSYSSAVVHAQVLFSRPDFNGTYYNATEAEDAEASIDGTGNCIPSNSSALQGRLYAAIKTSKSLDAPSGGSRANVGNVGFTTTPQTTTKLAFQGIDQTQSGPSPPDQALCVSNDWVYELVNNQVAIYSVITGARQGNIVSLATFFNVVNAPAGVNLGSGDYFDPRCTLDPSTGAMIFVTDVSFGANNLQSYIVLFAVKPTAADPLAGRTATGLISNDRTDFPLCVNPGDTCHVSKTCLQSGANNHCYGDYPTLGTDATAIWIAVDVYLTDDSATGGSIIYGVNKAQLLATTPAVPAPTAMVIIDGNEVKTLQPVATQVGNAYPANAMYFVGLVAGAVQVQAVINPAALFNGANIVTRTNLPFLPRALDYAAVGPFVQGNNNVQFIKVYTKTQQIVFDNNRFWGALNTLVTVNGVQQNGVAYFRSSPINIVGGNIAFTLDFTGYLGLAGNDVLTPAIAVAPDHTTAIISVVVFGTNLSPGTGYAIVDSNTQIAKTIVITSPQNPPGPRYVEAAVQPMKQCGPGVTRCARFGDYAAAVLAPDLKTVWVAGESFLASNAASSNWATFITAVQLTPQAKCKDVVLQANTNCQATPTASDLITAIDAGSTPGADGMLAFTLSPSPSPPGAATYTLAPAVYVFTLTAANGAGSSTCSAFVTVQTKKPTAVCAPALTLPATAGCAAHPTAAALLAAVNAGSDPGSGGPLTLTLSPAAPAGGVYTFPAGGSFPVTLTASNCAGSDSCSTLVTVTDQEDLQAFKISCGALPADGVVETPILTKNKATAVAVYKPSYTKTNGCPTTVVSDNLECGNCLIGSNKQQSGILDHCDSRVTSAGVGIGPGQIGRVAWTVSVTDPAGHSAVTDCAVCADHGGKSVTTLGHCPKPFTSATSCDFGTL